MKPEMKSDLLQLAQAVRYTTAVGLYLGFVCVFARHLLLMDQSKVEAGWPMGLFTGAACAYVLVNIGVKVLDPEDREYWPSIFRRQR